LTPDDTKYWDWSLDELAKYDFPAILNHVCQQTLNQKVIYVGHSQGNAQAFLGLSHNPQVANKIRLFVAIAPAFHISPPKHWALRWMVKMSKGTFFFLFGRSGFLPIMCQLQAIANPLIFSSLAFNMFCYLFNWGDTFWDTSRKPKYFMFTPRPTSCKLLTHWCDIIRFGTLHLYGNGEEPPKLCDVKDINCPTAIFYSPEDSLVHGDGLVNDMRQNNVDIFHVEKIDKYEHMDLIWAKDSTATVFSKLVDVLDRA
jgi:pimeloyl-ACP methyl ester carboxylesterase